LVRLIGSIQHSRKPSAPDAIQPHAWDRERPRAKCNATHATGMLFCIRGLRWAILAVRRVAVLQSYKPPPTPKAEPHPFDMIFVQLDQFSHFELKPFTQMVHSVRNLWIAQSNVTHTHTHTLAPFYCQSESNQSRIEWFEMI
jgi:hypothetical protein